MKINHEKDASPNLEFIFPYLQDPSHGWVAVPLYLFLDALDKSKSLSRGQGTGKKDFDFSYVDATITYGDEIGCVYLEEDCEWNLWKGIFIDTCGLLNADEVIKVDERPISDPYGAYIRDLPRLSPYLQSRDMTDGGLDSKICGATA